jgi:tetraacyldisaccharide 4'-kinase
VLDGSAFRELVSGRTRGLSASALRGLLAGAEWPYAWATRWRNRRYDTGRLPSHRVGVPVISVGNLTLGGTGKTPMVEWLARWFRARGARVALVSRGYGAEAGGRNDEALELEERLPDVPHLQNRDRVAAAAMAIEECECQLIVLDDGFQHRRLARDLDLVLIDALEPFGFEHVFPRGTLREPLAGLRRADCIALSRADLVDEHERRRIAQRVRSLAPSAAWLEVAHRPRRLVSSTGQREDLAALTGRRVAAFCGIGNPDGFLRTLRAAGAVVADFREFADHHSYDRNDVESLAAWADTLAVELVVCTAKDLVKLRVERLGRARLCALAVEVEIVAGQREFEDRLTAFLPAAG